MSEETRVLTVQEATLLRPFFDELEASQRAQEAAHSRLLNALQLVHGEEGWTFDLGRRVFVRSDGKP